MALDLGKQIGPLPMGAWMAVVAGGLGIALWSKQNRDGDSDETEVVEDVSGAEGVGTGPSWTAVPPPSFAPGGAAYESNEAWGQAAVNYLIGQGYPPGEAHAAISKALAGGEDINGNKMSLKEWTLWTMALLKLGSPPYPVVVTPPGNLPGPVTPPPDDTTPPPPPPGPGTTTVPPHHSVVAKRGDNISKIASKYGKSWQETWAFNLKWRNAATAAIMRARGPNLIFKGTTIWVPK